MKPPMWWVLALGAAVAVVAVGLGLTSLAMTIGEIVAVRQLISSVQKASADMDAVSDWLQR